MKDILVRLTSAVGCAIKMRCEEADRNSATNCRKIPSTPFFMTNCMRKEGESAHHKIQDISPLHNLTKLIKLYMWKNRIQDTTPLQNQKHISAYIKGALPRSHDSSPET